MQIYNDNAMGEAVSVFARPADIAASGPAPQIFQVYARNLDPARADVVAALVSGAERGEGRVLAKASSLSTTGSSDFSGVAVADKDLFLVGFSADSAAFSFLNAQKWGVMHTAGGVEAETAPMMMGRGGPPDRARISSQSGERPGRRRRAARIARQARRVQRR